MNNLKEKKLNDKGFSLVELIIVIAIMAVLIGVLAPQYLKYVERSRNSTDQDNATAIASALQVWASETDYGTKKAYTPGTGTIQVLPTGASVTTELNTSALKDATDNASINLTNTKCVSKTKWQSYAVNVTIAADGSASTSVVYYPNDDCSGTPVTP